MQGKVLNPMKENVVVAIICVLSILFNYSSRSMISIVVIPMKEEFGWSEKIRGTVVSAFFLGYLSTQIFGGYMSDKYGAKRVLALSILLWSSVLCITPSLGTSVPGLAICRILFGVFQGVTFPSTASLVSTWIPRDQQSFILSLVFGATGIGTAFSYVTTSLLIEYSGWRSAFYFFAALNVIWLLVTFPFTNNRPKDFQAPTKKAVSNLQIIYCRSFWAILFAKVGLGWPVFFMYWVPVYMNVTFKKEISEIKFLLMLPQLISSMCSPFIGYSCNLIVKSDKFKLENVRKTFQSIAFIGHAFFLSLMLTATKIEHAIAMLVIAAIFLQFTNVGLTASILDFAPRNAGFVYSVTNTSFNGIGFLSTFLMAYIAGDNGNWTRVVYIVIAFELIACAVFLLFSLKDRVDSKTRVNSKDESQE